MVQQLIKYKNYLLGIMLFVALLMVTNTPKFNVNSQASIIIIPVGDDNLDKQLAAFSPIIIPVGDDNLDV